MQWIIAAIDKQLTYGAVHDEGLCLHHCFQRKLRFSSALGARQGNQAREREGEHTGTVVGKRRERVIGEFIRRQAHLCLRE